MILNEPRREKTCALQMRKTKAPICCATVKAYQHLLCYQGHVSEPGRRRGLLVERRTPEREVGGSILTQVAVLCP